MINIYILIHPSFFFDSLHHFEIMNSNPTNKTYNSVKECMDDVNVSKRKMFNLLKEETEYKYINRNYYKNK